MLMSLLLATAVLTGPDPEGVIATAPSAPAPLDGTVAPEAASPESAARAQSRDTHGLTTDEQIAQWIAARDPGRSTWAEAEAGPLDDRKVHSEFSAGIGTGGYRQYGASVSLPIGDSGRLDLHYSKVENAPWGYGYGYAPYVDAGGYVFPGGGSRELKALEYESRVMRPERFGPRPPFFGVTAAED